MEKLISNLSKVAGPISGITLLAGLGIAAICKVAEIEAAICAGASDEKEWETGYEEESARRWNI